MARTLHINTHQYKHGCGVLCRVTVDDSLTLRSLSTSRRNSFALPSRLVSEASAPTTSGEDERCTITVRR
jgi:hypothetical protein